MSQYSNSKRSKSRHRLLVLLTLGLIQAIWLLSMDLCLPAFPSISRELSSSPASVQLALTTEFSGMAVGQLVVGPISDSAGGRLPLFAAMAVYVGTTFMCAFALSIVWLVSARFLQGLAAASAGVISLAIVRDLSEGPAMVSVLARLQLVNGVFVVGSPALGAVLLSLTDWRGLFLVLVGYGCALSVIVVASFFRKETLTSDRRAPFDRGTLGRARNFNSSRARSFGSA